MNFNQPLPYWVALLLLVVGTSVNAQQQGSDSPATFTRHYRFIGIGNTPISTTNIQTFSFELGYGLTRKIQLMAGPKFFVTDYQRFNFTSNKLGSFYGGFAGARFWWRGIPTKGWAYFSSAELHLGILSSDGSPFFAGSVRHTLSPELGNGFGRFSDNGFYFLFNFNFGFEIPINSNVGGEVLSSVRLSAGWRI